MSQTSDLQIQEEIVHLFDFTRNPFAKEKLANLFRGSLGTLSEIHSAQEIYKTFVEQGQKIKLSDYSKSEFLEVYHFLSADKDILDLKGVDFNVPFYISRKLQHCRSKCSQTVSMLKSFFTK